jgi:hypothetical protein
LDNFFVSNLSNPLLTSFSHAAEVTAMIKLQLQARELTNFSGFLYKHLLIQQINLLISYFSLVGEPNQSTPAAVAKEKKRDA